MVHAPRPAQRDRSGTTSRKAFESSTLSSASPSRSASGGKVRAVSDWLGEEPDFRSIAAQASRLIGIAQALRTIHPQHPMVVLGLDEGTLRLSARNASEGARIRQIEPRLVTQLRQHGIAVERLRIQSRRTEAASGERTRNGLAQQRLAIPDAALAELGAITAVMGPGRLGEALKTLLERQRRQRQG